MTALDSRRFGFSVDVHADGSHQATAAQLEALGFGTLGITGGQLDRLTRCSQPPAR